MRNWVATLLVLTACSDGTGSDPLAPGEFSASVSGAVTLRFDGAAWSGPTNPTYPQDRIILQDGQGNDVVMQLTEWVDLRPGRTSIGAFPNGEARGAFFLPNDRQFETISGFIELESVSAEGVVGRMEFDAVEIEQPAAGHTVHVIARFHTRRNR